MPIATDWTLYGAAGLPLWLILLILCAALALLHRGLAGERRGRSHPAGRFLPITLTLLALAVAWVAYFPVAVKVTTWEHQKALLLAVDNTYSMDRVLDTGILSDRLDLLAHWHPDALADRPPASRSLERVLERFRTDLAKLAADLDTAADHAAQGLPPSPTDRATRTRYADWRRTTWAQFAEATEEADAALPPQDDTARPWVDTYITHRDAFLQAIHTLPETAPEPVGFALPMALRALEGPTEGLRASLPPLQHHSDKVFLDARRKTLSPLLKEVTQRRRRDLAAALAEVLPHKSILPSHPDERRQTDLIALLEKSLATGRTQPASQLVLLSDGAENTQAKPASALSPLPDLPIYLVGTGVPSRSPRDLALLDWQCPSLARKAKTVHMQVQIKAPQAAGIPFAVELRTRETVLAAAESQTAGRGREHLALSFVAPDAGLHRLDLEVKCDGDTDPGNNHAAFSFHATDRSPKAYLLADTPHWDLAYLSLAAQDLDLSLTQVYTDGEEPKRGALGHSVPKTRSHWKRRGTVILHGPVFPGAAAGDATDLDEAIREEGTRLFVFADGAQGYDAWLAPVLDWKQPDPEGPIVLPLRLGADADHLPALRLAPSSVETARLFSRLPSPGRCVPVAPQDIVLVEDSAGTPVVSLGFYGSGRILLWGMHELYPMRHYDNARQVDRLLRQILAEWIQPDDRRETAEGLVLYPPLPAVGEPAWWVATDRPPPGDLFRAGTTQATAFTPGVANPLCRWLPETDESRWESAGQGFTVASHRNPTPERLIHDFNPEHLRSLAEALQGRAVSAREARDVLSQLTPETYTTQTATVYALGHHPLALVFLLVAAALHWVVRKLAGMVL